MLNGTTNHAPESAIMATIELCRFVGHGPMSSDDAGLYCQRCEDNAAQREVIRCSGGKTNGGETERPIGSLHTEATNYEAEHDRQAAVLEASVTYRKTYKGNEYTARVNADDTVILTLPSGATSQHKSLSAAASAVTGHDSINGRKFFGVDGVPRAYRKAAPVTVEVPLHETLAIARTIAEDAMVAFIRLLPENEMTGERNVLDDAAFKFSTGASSAVGSARCTYNNRIASEEAATLEAKRTEARAQIAELEKQAQAIRDAAGL